MEQMENHEKSEGRGLQQGTQATCISWQEEEGTEEDMSEPDRSRLKWKGKMKQGRKGSRDTDFVVRQGVGIW